MLHMTAELANIKVDTGAACFCLKIIQTNNTDNLGSASDPDSKA
jgi:hypothetical protein